MIPKAVFHWSGGKDSARGLYEILKEGRYEVSALLTSINSGYDRVSMHGVRTVLLEQQAKSIGIPLLKLMLPEMPSMELYEAEMHKTLNQLAVNGITHAVFGDIFLEDLRSYREKQLAELDMSGVFPLWKRPTDELIREFIDLGFKTVVSCVDSRVLNESFAGRVIDRQFLDELPENADPCGENGEFHTFVFDGPIFSKPIAFKTGEKVFRKYPSADEGSPHGFWYCDLLPAE